ncbi:MAG: hypothetical protein E5X67_11980 [Mesorhizobium sp.]|uniref:hypothetical protein n=1 Tax=Mesorhizobium sp. TaxID=1871066 RepID=UPI001214499F|nr:hypothetical protein [Mesorhizobium sp.]TIP28247.1 MAG: hypothetical protein E5X67_11980 [Mesorhizobium sp.]
MQHIPRISALCSVLQFSPCNIPATYKKPRLGGVLPQKRLPPTSSWPVWNGETPNERRIAGGIDLHQAVCGLDQTPSRAYPAAKRGILGQQFLCALKRELGLMRSLASAIARPWGSMVFIMIY